MKLHFITTSDLISYYFFYPLLVNVQRLKELNISIKFFEKIKEKAFQCDILFIDSKHFRSLWNNREYSMELLKRIREKSERLIWLDTTDSTGATNFQVLPYVDKYWKKQLLKDLDLYLNDYYGARIYTDYNSKNFNVKDRNVYSVEPIKKQYINKLSVSWNLGAGPILINNNILRLISFIPWSIIGKLAFKDKVRNFTCSSERVQSLCFRGSNKYKNKALSFQRLKTIEKLKARGVETVPVKQKEFIEEIRKSKIAVSPFGNGEVCFRDFEIILGGAVLFKPSMEHLKTYPDLYIDKETYISCKWDFSDFDERIDDLLANPDTIAKISQQAQEKYQYFLSEKGQEGFCIRFIDMLKF